LVPEAYPIRWANLLSESQAEEEGFFWQTLWNFNSELKSLRQNPNVLFAGDVVLIPELVIREESCPTDACHRFVKKGIPAKFRLVVERFNRPIAAKRYVLVVDGAIHEGTTSDTGLVEVAISPTARRGTLRFPDENIEVELELGNMDPPEEIIGIQERLSNLGFYLGELTGQIDDNTREAIELFQTASGIDATGELDANTRVKLFSQHDQEHPQSEEEPAPQEESGSQTEDGDADPESEDADVDDTDDDEELERLQTIED
jgi:Putative peptidoglycan binding domain